MWVQPPLVKYTILLLLSLFFFFLQIDGEFGKLLVNKGRFYDCNGRSNLLANKGSFPEPTKEKRADVNDILRCDFLFLISLSVHFPQSKLF